MAKQKKSVKESREIKKTDDSKLFAFLAVFLSIIGFIIALVAKKDDEYVMYYAKQSLVLFIAWIIVAIAAAILGFIPIVGAIISWIAWALVIILWIIAFINALSGEKRETPIIGLYARGIKL
jgi:uncharacterized membrane protein